MRGRLFSDLWLSICTLLILWRWKEADRSVRPTFFLASLTLYFLGHGEAADEAGLAGGGKGLQHVAALTVVEHGEGDVAVGVGGKCTLILAGVQLVTTGIANGNGEALAGGVGGIGGGASQGVLERSSGKCDAAAGERVLRAGTFETLAIDGGGGFKLREVSLGRSGSRDGGAVVDGGSGEQLEVSRPGAGLREGHGGVGVAAGVAGNRADAEAGISD